MIALSKMGDETMALAASAVLAAPQKSGEPGLVAALRRTVLEHRPGAPIPAVQGQR